ncbi:hypothetical protein BMS3Abin08_00070 [bacterium BMS3Abin08]|nr:hypothetical protein BMS3Abin08_00070 [bacterium BMS3Abin08]
MQKSFKALLLSIFILSALLIIGTGEVFSPNSSPGEFIKLGVSTVANAAETPSVEFAWHANRPGIKTAQIALGRATTLSFEFILKGQFDVSQIKFGIPREFVKMGIQIDPKVVDVIKGEARSKAIFAVPPGMPLGKFDMLIVAVDAKTGKKIGTGKIPFMLLPAGVGGC